MKQKFIYQIFYDDASLAALDPEFIPLDNSANERADWREYWPIRQYLGTTELNPDAYYGFLSPKFCRKTGLDGKAVAAFIDSNPADVFLFSPFVEAASFFLSVFENGESSHPGLMSAMQQLVDGLGIKIYLAGAVCDFGTTVYSNYVVAKPSFWSTWLTIGEHMFSICEEGSTPLAAVLNAATPYPMHKSEVAMKIFVMERMATLVLLISRLSVKYFDPFAITRSGIPASLRDHDMRIANALKMAFLATGDMRYIESFNRHRTAVIADIENARKLGGNG